MPRPISSDVFLEVVVGVGDALDDAGAADHRVDAFVADQFFRGLRRDVELALVVFVVIGDRPAVNAAIGVDAVEIGAHGVVGFLEAADAAHRGHGADRNGLAGRFLSVVHPAIRFGECRRRSEQHSQYERCR